MLKLIAPHLGHGFMSATSAASSFDESFTSALTKSLTLCESNLKTIGSLETNQKLVFHVDGRITTEKNSYSRSFSSTLSYLGSFVTYEEPKESREIRYLQLFVDTLNNTILNDNWSPKDIFTIIENIKHYSPTLTKTLINTYREERLDKSFEITIVTKAYSSLNDHIIRVLDLKTDLIAYSPDQYFSEYENIFSNSYFPYIYKIAFVFAKVFSQVDLLKNVDIEKLPQTSKSIYTKALFKYLKLSIYANQSNHHYALAFSELIIHLFHPKKADVLDSIVQTSNALEQNPSVECERDYLADFIRSKNFGEIRYFYINTDTIPWHEITTSPEIPKHSSILIDDELGSFVEIKS